MTIANGKCVCFEDVQSTNENRQNQKRKKDAKFVQWKKMNDNKNSTKINRGKDGNERRN